MRRVMAALSIALAAGACAGTAPEVPGGPDGVPDPVLVAGRDIFEGRCANCHGAAGDGNQGPKLADGAVVEAYPDFVDQVDVVAEGRDEMPSFDGTLSAAEIDAVVRYTREVL